MEIGCGFRVHEIKGHEYVYFWHYEEREGRSRQLQEYVGPTRASGTGRRLTGLIDAYYARASAQLARDLAGRRAAAMSLR